jgi:hypothetical protein
MNIEATTTKTKCTPRCWKAKSKACRCSCGGENHGVEAQPRLFTGTTPPNQEAIHPKYRSVPMKEVRAVGSLSAERYVGENQQLTVGDLVYIREGAPMGGEKAYVYDTYQDFDDKSKLGVSLITETGRDTGGWSWEEQKQWLTYIGRSAMGDYQFQNVIKLEQDFREGVFGEAFRKA